MKAWIERTFCDAGDDEETRRRHVNFTFASILVIPAGLIWGALYFAFGERSAAAIPAAYSVLTLVNLAGLRRWRRHDLFRVTEHLMALVLPVVLQIALGGYFGSGGVIFWSFLAALLCLLYGGQRESLGWFAAWIVVVVGSALLQPRLAVDNALPSWLVVAFYVLNVCVVSSTAFFVLYSFVTDRRKLRALEVAYLNQELMLRQSEKLATLGTLAAGVAHELNNPAAATRRAAEQLREAFLRLEDANQRLRAFAVSGPAQAELRSLREKARARAAPSGLGALARADREAAVEEWLEERSIPEAGRLAAPLAEQGLDPDALSRLQPLFGAEAFPAVLDWATSQFPAHELLDEIGTGSARISEIVSALKNYSYLDRDAVQMVDLREGLEDTLVILKGRLEAGIRVRREYGADVPRLPAHGSALNQVWTNVLVNAVEAMGETGTITIRTRREGAWAVVEIEDDGPGIPKEIAPRIFDPFFTTKQPGQGTGLGLSTSHAIVTQRHGGEMRADSRPGLTRFTVKLPLEPPAAPEGR